MNPQSRKPAPRHPRCRKATRTASGARDGSCCQSMQQTCQPSPDVVALCARCAECSRKAQSNGRLRRSRRARLQTMSRRARAHFRRRDEGHVSHGGRHRQARLRAPHRMQHRRELSEAVLQGAGPIPRLSVAARTSDSARTRPRFFLGRLCVDHLCPLPEFPQLCRSSLACTSQDC